MAQLRRADGDACTMCFSDWSHRPAGAFERPETRFRDDAPR